MLSRQRVPWGQQVLMLVNWVEGNRAQSFSFLRMSNSKLCGDEPKSPSTTSSLSPVEEVMAEWSCFSCLKRGEFENNLTGKIWQLAVVCIQCCLFVAWVQPGRLTFECFLDAGREVLTLAFGWLLVLTAGIFSWGCALNVDVHQGQLNRTNLKGTISHHTQNTH